MLFSLQIKSVLLVSLLVLTFALHAGGVTLVQTWELAGLDNPESVVYDPVNDVLYVSNVNGAPNDKDANGYISKVSTDGHMIAKDWVTGLNAPKGLAITRGKLYTADIDTLVEIDIASAAISNRYTVADAKFLNDVAADPDGTIYVSDMVLNRIHSLDKGKFSIWLESDRLLNPNGLHIKDDSTLIVGAWGVMTDGAATETPGHMLSINRADKSIHSIGDGTPIGNLDGIEEDTDGSYFVTDWVGGKLFHIYPGRQPDLILTLEQGMADLELIPASRSLYIPMMNNNVLLGFKLN